MPSELAPEQVSLASPTATRAVLERFDLALKHRLGQHFLINRHVLDRIVGLAEVAEGDRVLEVGPGIGTLTQALLQAGAQVIAIEADESLLPALAYSCEPWSERLSVIAGDALAVTESQLEEVAAGPLPTKLVANLPYNVAATLVLSFLDRFPMLQSCTVMVQREVAERMAAQPGTKTYGAYTVKLALRACVTDSFRVPPSAFMPPPHVDSTVLRLDRHDDIFEGLELAERTRLEAKGVTAEQLVEAASLMADAAFSQRRKTIANAMRGYFRGRGEFGAFICDHLAEILKTAEIPPTVRAETLPPATYLTLAATLSHFPRGTG